MNKAASGERAVVITGATKGLGRELSLAFATAGFKVIGIYRSDTESACKIEREFDSKEFDGYFVQQDITVDDVWPEFDELIKDFADHQLTLIANASSTFVPGPFHLIDWSVYDDLIAVNVKGTVLMLKRLLPLMSKARHGTFVSILSEVLAPPQKGFAAYIAAKSALDGLTKSIAVEFAQKGLRVFSVSPGFMQTALTDKWSKHLKSIISVGEDDAPGTAEYAARILDLTQDPETKGNGENYRLI